MATLTSVLLNRTEQYSYHGHGNVQIFHGLRS